MSIEEQAREAIIDDLMNLQGVTYSRGREFHLCDLVDFSTIYQNDDLALMTEGNAEERADVRERAHKAALAIVTKWVDSNDCAQSILADRVAKLEDDLNESFEQSRIEARLDERMAVR